MSGLITVTHVQRFHNLECLYDTLDLECLYRVNDIWNIMNTLSNIIFKKIHDIIDFDFFERNTTVINFIFADIRLTTFSTYALLWDFFLSQIQSYVEGILYSNVGHGLI